MQPLRLRLAVLDDYQRAAERFADWSVLDARVERVVFDTHLDDPGALAARLEPFDMLCVMRERTRIDAALLARLPRLRLIVTTGPRNAAIDLDAARARGIVVCGTDAIHSGTPELTWALILALARRLPAERDSVRAGRWQASVGTDLHGSTLGILGLGRVGTRVAAVGQAFGMKLIAWSPNLTDDRARAAGARLVSREALFIESDFLVLSLQLRAATRGLVGREQIARMKPGAFLINTSRGELVDDQALIEALEARRIAGAGIDTFAIEPLPADHPYRRLDNVLATPHIGYVTDATYRLFFSQTLENVLAWLDGRPVRLVNEQVFGA